MRIEPENLIICALGVVACGMVLCASSCVVVPVGHCGVRTSFGRVTGEVAQEGMNFKLPFVSGIRTADCRVQKVDVEASGATKDLQDVKTTLAINVRLDAEKAPDVYKTVGDEYVEKIVIPRMTEVYKATVAQFNAEELITKRDEVSTQTENGAKNALEPYGVLVDGVSIVRFDFSQAFNEAVEAKVTAEQEALKAKNELERVKFEAEQSAAKAKGEADAILAKAQAQSEAARLVSTAITPSYVAFEAIQKWDGKAPTHLLGDATPVLLSTVEPK